MQLRYVKQALLATLFSLSLNLVYAESELTSTQKQAIEKGLLPLDELRTFTEIFDRIKKAYVEDVDDKTLLDNAIQGMLEGLDPHSAYLNKESFDDLQMNTKGEFGGLGIEVQMENGFIKVVTPIDDTPAIKAGIEPQDLIIKIDDTPIKGLSLQEAVKMMRGAPGTHIRLTIIREGEPGPIETEIVRDIIKVKSVKSRVLEDGYGYIRITQFQTKTGRDLVAAIDKFRENDKQLKGLVLDLRNNPGGVLSGAVEVSDAFLKGGLIVYTKGRIADSELTYEATEEDPSRGVPTVVLINGGSASASEIVAGALQDHSRAVIMGTASFGKGSVQTVLPLNNERALKLTTALYYTPNGRSIQAEGIVPDLVVTRAKVTAVKDRLSRVKEANLNGHLENVNGGKKTNNKQKTKQNITPSMALAESDFQLYEALSLLKGINIVRPLHER